MQPYSTFEEVCKSLAAHPEAWAKICHGQSYIPLLPVLEHAYDFIVMRLVDGLVGAGLPRAEVERVSLRELVVFALSGPMRWGWGGYAVSWIEAGFPVDAEIASALFQISQDKRFPQRTRHRAFAAAKRWRRAHADPAGADVRDDSLPPPDKTSLVLLPGLDRTGFLLRGFREALDPSIRSMLRLALLRKWVLGRPRSFW